MIEKNNISINITKENVIQPIVPSLEQLLVIIIPLHWLVLLEVLYVLFSLAAKGISFDNLFEEVPVIVKNSNLMNALLCEVEETSSLPNRENFLSLATG